MRGAPSPSANCPGRDGRATRRRKSRRRVTHLTCRAKRPGRSLCSVAAPSQTAPTLQPPAAGNDLIRSPSVSCNSLGKGDDDDGPVPTKLCLASHQP
jgi:hypothetical protein